MRLKPEHQEAWSKLFGSTSTPQVAITIITHQRFRRLPKNETVLQHWTPLFGNRNKIEAIALLERIVQRKERDFQIFRETFAQKYMKPVVDSNVRYEDFMSQD